MITSYYSLGNDLRGFHSGVFSSDEEAWDVLSNRFDQSFPSRSGRIVSLSKVIRYGNTLGGNDVGL